MSSPRHPGFCRAWLTRSFVLIGLAWPAAPHAIADESFPFVIPGDDASPTVVDRSGLIGGAIAAGDANGPIDPEAFVRIDGSHFTVPVEAGSGPDGGKRGGRQRLRFWGMNLCFGANFPTHEEADLVAAHLAKLGCNAVRFHHMDMQDAPSGIWAPMGDDGVRRFDPEMVDRLDYFLNQLHERGIYADLNLHVSRTLTPAEGFPTTEGVPWWAEFNKWVMYYDRDVQAEVKRYCRDLLTHKNPYRGNRRRCDDAGIAVVEMLNENYFSQKGYELYRQMPPRFQASLITHWNQWLADRYGDTDAMVRAWAAGEAGLGETVLAAPAIDVDGGPWRPQSSLKSFPTTFSTVTLTDGTSARSVRLAPIGVTDNDYEQQFLAPGLSVTADAALTLSYWVRSDSPRSYHVELSSSAGGEWRDLGLHQLLDAGPTWQRVQRVIIPGETIDDGVNFAFSIGDDATPIEFADITLRRGSVSSELPADQTLASGNVGIPDVGAPVLAHRDMKQFMVDTEVAWVDELKRFLKDDLGVKVPVTASQLNYHDQRVHDELNDFVDLHNYWHHPEFPSGGNWDAERWTVGNDPMEADPTLSSWPTNSLLMRMPWRVAGKPATLSEWSFPEPGLASAGCVPMAAMLAAIQDWDGIFFFQYDSFGREGDDGTLADSPFFADRVNGFFSFNGQPAKLATFSQFGNLFLRGDLPSLTTTKVADPKSPIDGRWALTHKLMTSTDVAAQTATLDADAPDATDLTTGDRLPKILGDGGETLVQPFVRWRNAPPDFGVVECCTAASRGFWGTLSGQSFDAAGVSLTVGDVSPNYGTVLLSSTDGTAIESADSLVLLAVSRSENTGMKFNADRTSVGSDWGTGPTLVTGLDLTLTLPRPAGLDANGKPRSWSCYALDGTGRRKAAVAVMMTAETATIVVSPQSQTLWYEVTTQPKVAPATTAPKTISAVEPITNPASAAGSR